MKEHNSKPLLRLFNHTIGLVLSDSLLEDLESTNCLLSPASVNCAIPQERVVVTVHFANNTFANMHLDSFLFVKYFGCMNFLRYVREILKLQDFK